MKVKHAQPKAPIAPSQAAADKANPQAPPSAKPGEKGPEQANKAPKIKRVPWGKRDAEGELVEKITAQPADFNPKTHEGLKRKDFATFADYLDHRAGEVEKHAASLRTQAKEERSGVGKVTKGKQKRLIGLKEKYEALLKELKESGVDVDAAMAVGSKA